MYGRVVVVVVVVIGIVIIVERLDIWLGIVFLWLLFRCG